MAAARHGVDHASHDLGGRYPGGGYLGDGYRSTIEMVRAATGPDHDGAITRAEFTRLLTALGQPATAADAAFTALDRDHDDRITRAEYVAAWEDYLLSDTPDSAWALAFTGL